MKVYLAMYALPLTYMRVLGVAKTKKGALKILKRNFPHMRGNIDDGNLVSDASAKYILNIIEMEVEE